MNYTAMPNVSAHRPYLSLAGPHYRNLSELHICALLCVCSLPYRFGQRRLLVTPTERPAGRAK